ncbi:MAG: trehalose-6-phosphate synthase [Acidimicrobiia bacterium]
MTVVVSNRGPFQFARTSDGGFEAKPGSGGVASTLRPLLTSGAAGPNATWIAAALDDDDRAASREGAADVPGIALRLLDHDPDVHRLYYDVVSNGTLWFLHHGLFDLVRRPRFDHRFREAWAAYELVNRSFADAVAELAGDGDTVLVQDYHLALVAEMVNRLRPDLRVVHFTHTAFCGPNSIRVLPDEVAASLCRSMACSAAGFHSARWARAYEASAREVLGDEAELGPTFVAPLAPDPDELARVAESPEATTAGAEIDDIVGDRQLVVRVDRIDPSKNIARGFAAYDLLLTEHREWREQIVFVARLTSSRQTLPEYLAYTNEVEQAAARVNERWATKDWQPVVLDTTDDYPRTVAVLKRSDVLLVNPLKDGLNLVAMEGPLVNDRNGVVCLSRDAGAWDLLGESALPIHPFDLEQTANTLHQALSMPAKERSSRAGRLRELTAARTPRNWLDDQLKAAGAR